PVVPVVGDGDRGLGVAHRVEGGHRRAVRAVDLPVAVVVGRAQRELVAARFGHGDLGGRERLAVRAAGRLPQGLEAGAAELAAQLGGRGGQRGGGRGRGLGVLGLVGRGVGGRLRGD